VSSEQKRIQRTVDEGRVKLHVFKPSERKLWTVVGKDKEYWLDPDINFCSCNAYYFGTLEKEAMTCYHLKSVKTAKEKKRVQQIIFSDDEFLDFTTGLMYDF